MLEINALHWLDATREEGRNDGIVEGRNVEKKTLH